MEIQVNETQVRAMAKRLREAAGSDAVSHSKSLEILARTLGFKHFDELSGVMKKEAPKVVPVPPEQLKDVVPFELFCEAFCCDEFGDGPDWASWTVSPAFIKVLLDAQALCVAQGLEHVAVSESPHTWDQNDEYRIQYGSLYVSDDSFWFRGNPKHADYAVETRAIDIEALLGAIKGTRRDDHNLAWADGVLFYSGAGEAQSFARGLLEDEVIDINEGCIDQMPGTRFR